MRKLIRSIYNAIVFSAYSPKIIDRLFIKNTRSISKRNYVKSSGVIRRSQLLIDVSVIFQSDSATGIQRMVRSVLNELRSNPPVNFDVRTVVATRNLPYRYVDWDRGNVGGLTENAIVSPQAGDIFLALDLSAHILPSHHFQLVEWKANGVAFHFLIYDLLPLINENWFSKKLVLAFRRWIKQAVALADSAICISSSVENDFLQWTYQSYNLPPGTIPTNVISLGSDISSNKSSSGLPEEFDKIIDKVNSFKTALIVGTLEPRKAHLQIIEAFEKLWDKGSQFNLVIVGKKGWKTETLQKKILNHEEFNSRLFWLSNASDEALIALYKACSGVIVASYAEGYGLPLTEALDHKKPVLARDIPVFREQRREGVEYFSARDEIHLENKIHDWLITAKDINLYTAPCSLPSWDQTANEIKKIITQQN